MDQILGIVEHDRLGARRAGGFVVGQRGIELVEAVGLGRRPVGGDLDRATRGSMTAAIAAAVAGSLR